MELMLKNACLIEYAEFILSNEDVKRPKPDPEIYLTAMAKLNLQPHDCLIVEDNVNGIKAAIASGGHVLKVIDVTDVNYANLRRAIESFSNVPAPALGKT
jgi:beta-phosphoglucomutase-like phosphatase (HAD superfamily)